MSLTDQARPIDVRGAYDRLTESEYLSWAEWKAARIASQLSNLLPAGLHFEWTQPPSANSTPRQPIAPPPQTTPPGQ